MKGNGHCLLYFGGLPVLCEKSFYTLETLSKIFITTLHGDSRSGVYIQWERKILSHISKEVSSIIRCIITSYLIAITLIKIAYVLYMCVKKECKLV